MNETINIENYGVYPSTGNHTFYISFYLTVEGNDLPTRIIKWESCDYDVNPEIDMNKADRIAFVKENFGKSELLTDEMIDLIDEDNRLQSEILQAEYREVR